MTDRVDINRLLADMRTLKSQTQAFGATGAVRDGQCIASVPGLGAEAPGRLNFGDLLGQALNKVNSVQQASSNLSQAYLKGEPGVDITQVMIASQKSSLTFQAATQVRNKLVEAYKDVMNMPI